MPFGAIPKPQPDWPIWVTVLYWIFVSIIAIVALGGTVMKMFKFIKKGNAGLLLRGGRPVIRNGDYVRKGPGIHPVVPFTDTIDDLSVQEKVADNPLSLLFEKKDKQYAAVARPKWRVIDTPQGLHDALFVAEHPSHIVELEVLCAIAAAVTDAVNVDDQKAIETTAFEQCSTALRDKYGIELTKLGLMPIVRIPVQVLGDTLGSTGDPDELHLLPRVAASVHSIGLADGTQA
jgi:hypothetical protein